VPLVYGTKCHPTSVVLAPAVLSCLSMSLCTTTLSQCRSVLQHYHRLVSVLLHLGMRTEIITVVNMKVTFLWIVAQCGLINIYLCFRGLPSSMYVAKTN
jgi:hypothetical protein